jgi:protein O-mannosyl-transferase
MTERTHDATRPVPGAFTERTAFVAVVVLTVACFAPGLANGLLVWDDSGYIVENTHIRDLSWDTVSWAFTTFYCNYWAPLTWLSLAVDYAVWGLDPAGYHLTNILLHALNAGLFFLLSGNLLRAYVKARGPGRAAGAFPGEENVVACAALAALLFSLHPLRVESVVWAAERKDVLFLFFGLAAIIAYVWYVRNEAAQAGPQHGPAAFLSSPVYWLAVALFALSLLSKSMLVTLPLALLILDWFPLRRLTAPGAARGVLLEKVPLFVLSGIVSVITALSQRPVMVALEQSDMTSRVLIAVRSLISYLGLTLWPAGLGPFYLRPMTVSLLDAEYALPLVGFLLVSAACAALVKRQPVFLAVWLFYLVTLLPVLGVAKVGPVSVADRFTYVSALPVSLLIALGIVRARERYARSRAIDSAFFAAVAGLLLASSVMTVRQISFWKDDVTIWTRAIELEPQTVGRPYYERSYAYAMRGELGRAMEDIDKAIAIAESKRYHRMFELYASRARIFAARGDLERALSDYERVIGCTPYPEQAGYYMERGMLYQNLGMDDLAAQDFRSAGMAQQVR